MKKRIALIYAVAILLVLIGDGFNVVWTNNISWLGDFTPIHSPYDNATYYASVGDCLIALGFLTWAFGTGVWYQSKIKETK